MKAKMQFKNTFLTKAVGSTFGAGKKLKVGKK